MPRVGAHGSEARLARGGKLDVLADHPTQNLLDVSEDSAQVEDFRSQHLLAREGQKLSRQPRRALTRFANLFEIFVPGMPLSRLGEQNIAVTQNRRQDVVEVVCHAAGEPPDRFHLLGLDQLRLELLALGHVLNDSDYSQRGSRLVPNDVGLFLDPPNRAVRTDDPMLDRVGFAVLDGCS